MSLHGSYPTGAARRRVLLLGGVRSGRTRLARDLVEEVDSGTVWFVSPVEEAAVAGPDEDHRFEDGTWQRVRLSGDPNRLVTLVAHADPADTLVIDDLDAWVGRLLAQSPADLRPRVLELVEAVERGPARVVLVSREIGMGTPASATQALAEAVGATNRRLAEACDAVALLIAGQPLWIKPSTPAGTERLTYVGRATPPPRAGEPAAAADAGPALTAGPAEPAVDAGPALTAGPAEPAVVAAVGAGRDGLGEEPPMPDEEAAAAATAALAAWDVPGRGLGRLARAVAFAAGTQGTATPAPFRSPRALLLGGDDTGAATVGLDAGTVARRIAAVRSGDGPLARLAALAGVPLRVLDLPPDSTLDRTVPLPDATVDGWLADGARLADGLVDNGADLLVLAADGAGLETVAATVIAALTGAEVPALLPPVLTGSGEHRRYDDDAWMARCVAARDALYRLGPAARDARSVLRTLAGPVIGTATGLLVRATRRRTPVLLDGPVGMAAALVARDLAGQSRHWLLLPDGGHTGAVPQAAEMLDVPSLLPAGMDVGEGGGALALLPLIQSALALAADALGRPDHSTMDGQPATVDGASAAAGGEALPEAEAAVPEDDRQHG